MALSRQLSAFVVVGVIATGLHYAALIGLKELAGVAVIPATLTGYVLGGLVSYILTRKHVFQSERRHDEAGWRFAVVAAVGFCLTWGFMRLFVSGLAAPYLPAQMVTTGIVMFWSFAANRFWTFGSKAHP
jgi:putative flippase GtrA